MTDPLDPRDRELDDALRAMFTPPPLADTIAKVHTLANTRPRSRWLRPWVGLLLAAAVLATLSIWWSRTPPPDNHALPGLWAAAYRDVMARGMDDRGCCDGNADLRALCRSMFTATLDIAPDADVTMCGCYRGGPSGGAAAALMRCGEESVCVFVLPRDRVPSSIPSHVDGLRVHRRDFGALVVFEVSPHGEPRALPHLIAPEG